MFDNKAYQKKYYQDNHESELVRLREVRRKRRTFLQAIILDAKNTPCADCGVQYHFSAMDFDHINGDKLFNVSGAHGSLKSEDKIRSEIAKCEVVCSNCHRVRTYNRGVRSQTG